MIRINLLPKKVSKKKMGLMQHLALAGGAFLLVLVAIGYLWVQQNGKISSLNEQVAAAKAEKEKLKDVNAQKAKYENNIARLKNQLDIIIKIQAGRLLPVRLLDELTKVLDGQTPVWLTNFTMSTGGGVKMDGISLSNPDLAAFVTRLERTPFYRNVDLLFSEKQMMEEREVFRFSLTAQPQTEDDAAPAKAVE